MAEVTVIGISDAGAESLSEQALSAIAGAQLLCGGERHLAFFPNYSRERLTIKGNIPAVVERLRAERRSAVVLASGDPCFYGIAPILVRALGHDRVRILPGIGSVQMAFARLGDSWQDATVLSAHGRPLLSMLRPALHEQKVAILTDERNSPEAIAEALLKAGSDDAKADVFEHLGGPCERHVSGRLSDLTGQEFAPLNLLVIRRERDATLFALGLSEEAFVHRRGMITKAEVRAVSLAALRLGTDATIWDVGAGCGSVAIEAAALAPHGEVYAIERDAEQQEYLVDNRRRFRAGNVIPVPGEAPDVLRDLPAPNAVFIGGSGGRLSGILLCCMESLRPAGRIVLNLVTLEHIGESLALLPSEGWAFEMTQVSIARTRTTAGLTRLAALNPVFILRLERAA